MKKIIIVLLAVLVLAEYFVWRGYISPKKNEQVSVAGSFTDMPKADQASSGNFSDAVGAVNFGDFPSPTVEERNGRMERTIHIGVRQFVWEPSRIVAKKGELVRLIVHNADVKHGLVIPELGIMNIDIPEEGAVIEFVPDKQGTFEFFCSYYCGDGHMDMRGEITIE